MLKAPCWPTTPQADGSFSTSAACKLRLEIKARGGRHAPNPCRNPCKMAMLGHVGRRFAPFSGPRVVEVMALLWLAAWTSPLPGRAHAARGRLLDAMLLSAL